MFLSVKHHTHPFVYNLVVKNITELGFMCYSEIRGGMKTGVKEERLHSVMDKGLILS